METRKHRELKDEESEKIYSTYHNWKNSKKYKDIEGFCKSASIEEIRLHDYVLTPGRYVGLEEIEDDGVDFDEKLNNLTSKLLDLFDESVSLENKIKESFKVIKHDIQKL
jgi:type I restriction enzyme M protein